MLKHEFCGKRHTGRAVGWVVAALLAANVYVSGCSAMHVPVIKDAIKAGSIPELPSGASVGYFFPEPAGRQHYREIALVNSVSIGGDEQSQKTCSFVLGRRASDGEWEVVSAAQRGDDGTWRRLSVEHPE